jgi:opacity protein-like surface antigen
MRTPIFAATAMVVASTAAYADEQVTEQCFDMGSLTYIDCSEPVIEDIEDVQVIEETVEHDFVFEETEETIVHDVSPWYVGVAGGVTWLEDTSYNAIDTSYKLGSGINAHIGYAFDDLFENFMDDLALRLEAELGYMGADVDSHGSAGNNTGEAEIFYSFLSTYFDLALLEDVDWVFGFGVGAGNVGLDLGAGDDRIDDSDTTIGLHLDTGVSFDITESWVLDATYRYLWFNAIAMQTETGTDNDDVSAHQALIGLRWRF